MLILFDIDGTLITSRSEVTDGGSRDGVGTASMIEAGRNLFGPAFTLSGIEIAGCLDARIWRDAAERNRIPDAEAKHEGFRAEYARVLRARLGQGARVRMLPGVRALVERLAQVNEFTLGLLTGNYPETGRMKIEAAGLDSSLFSIGAWGCDGASRRDLPPVAMSQYAQRHGRKLSGPRVVIIGDTPHDIDCAKAHGCRSIGVATGAFSLAVLRKAGADHAVEDLSATNDILCWLQAGVVAGH